MSLSLEPRLHEAPEPAPLTEIAPPPPPEWRQYLTRRNVWGGLLLLWLLSGLYLVATDQQAVVTRFGKFQRIEVPGLHYHLPYPVEQITKLKAEQLQAATIGGEPADGALGRTDPLRAQFLTGDQNIINVRAVVQYNVKAPMEYLFLSRDVAQTVTSAVESELGREIGSRSVDDVLTTEKIAIQEAVKQRAQKVLDEYNVGVAIYTVNIDRTAPPDEAKEAFADVAGARADAARIVNQAEGYSNDVVPRARGEAQQLLESAQGYKQRKINEAAGDASRFTQLSQEYSKAAAVTSHRLYIEAMEQILPKIKKTIIDRQGNNVDMTIIRREPEPARPANPQQQPR
jgi:membrane protease subunit HflK